MTRNNQQSFDLLTIFEQHVTSARPRCFRDSFVRDMCCKRQERRLQAVIPADLLEYRYLHRGHFLIKITDSAMSACRPGTFAWFGGVL